MNRKYVKIFIQKTTHIPEFGFLKTVNQVTTQAKEDAQFVCEVEEGVYLPKCHHGTLSMKMLSEPKLLKLSFII